MAEKKSLWSNFSLLDRTYVGVRVGLLALVWLGPLIAPTNRLESGAAVHAYTLTLSAFSVVSLAFCLGLMLYPQRHTLLYFSILPIDIVYIGFTTSITGHHNSIFYLGYFILSAVYALYFSLRVGAVVGALSGAAFLAFNYQQVLSGQWFDMIVKSVFMIGVAIMISWISELGRIEKSEVKRLNEQLSDANIELQRRITELHAVSEMAMVIHATLDFDALAKLVLDLLQKVLNLRRCALMIMDKKKGEILFQAAQGLPEKAAENLMLGVASGDMAPGNAQEPDAPYLKCRPILDQEKMMGVLCTESGPIDELSEEDMLVLSAVASELAVAVENARLYELTRKLAITDELTELFNYRHLQEQLQTEHDRAQRYNRSLSLIMIDVDDFKLYNDTYGHLQGDQVLAEMGALFSEHSRETDLVARYGGEEFCFLLPETDISGAFVAAEKLRELVSEYRFPGGDGQRTVQLTISLGVATYPMHAEDVSALLREADDALYIAKTTGRNRVCSPRDDT